MTMTTSLPAHARRLSASTRAGDLRPSRASRRRQGRLPDEPRAVGQIGPPAFLMPFPAHQADSRITTSREAHPTTERRRRARGSFDSGSSPPTRPRTWSHTVTATTASDNRRSPAPAASGRPSAGGRAASRRCSSRASRKRFVVGRKQASR